MQGRDSAESKEDPVGNVKPGELSQPVKRKTEIEKEEGNDADLEIKKFKK